MTYFTILKEEAQEIIDYLRVEKPESDMIPVLRQMLGKWPMHRERMRMSPTRRTLSDLTLAALQLRSTSFDRMIRYRRRRWPPEDYEAPKATYKQLEKVAGLLSHVGDDYRGPRPPRSEVKEMDRKKASRLITRLNKYFRRLEPSKLVLDVELYIKYTYHHGGWPFGRLGEAPSLFGLKLMSEHDLNGFKRAIRRHLRCEDRLDNAECAVKAGKAEW